MAKRNDFNIMSEDYKLKSLGSIIPTQLEEETLHANHKLQAALEGVNANAQHIKIFQSDKITLISLKFRDILPNTNFLTLSDTN